MKNDLVALVTGGAKRIGRTIALHLATQGYDIALHYHTSKQQAEKAKEDIEKLGRHCILINADLCTHTACDTLVEQCIAGMGNPALLIHNASVFLRDQINNYDDTSLHTHMQLHCFAATHLIRNLYEIARHHEHKSHIILMGDAMRGWSISPTYVSYSISKLALANLPDLLAREVAPQLRINMIHPGATLPGEMDDSATFKKLEDIIPLDRVSCVEEICQTIDYLEQCPSITGQHIFLGGGMHLSHNKT